MLLESSSSPQGPRDEGSGGTHHRGGTRAQPEKHQLYLLYVLAFKGSSSKKGFHDLKKKQPCKPLHQSNSPLLEVGNQTLQGSGTSSKVSPAGPALEPHPDSGRSRTLPTTQHNFNLSHMGTLESQAPAMELGHI